MAKRVIHTKLPAKLTTTDEVAVYADQLLNTAAVPDFTNALNGLQFQNQSQLRSIAAAVDFSTRGIEGAKAANANLLLVHHGMFWGGLTRLTGTAFRLVRLLLEHDIAVYSSHIPLDCHPRFGNNVLLAKELGLAPNEGFARFEGISIGVAGKSDIPTRTLVANAASFALRYGHTARATPIAADRRTKHWGICSGAGASAETLREAVGAGIDTLIVGEGPHWTAIAAEENDLAIIYAGHYATETLGVCALAQHLAERFGVPWSFVSAPTGL